MTGRRFAFLMSLAALGLAPALAAQQRRPITFEDFASARMVSDPQLSPDGRWLLYAVRSTDLVANKRTTRTFVAPVLEGNEAVGIVKVHALAEAKIAN